MALDIHTSTDLCRLLSDPSRLRLLALLEVEDLTVAELTQITGLTQSRVSTHLAKLKERGLVSDRRVGTSSFYRANERGMPEAARQLWQTLRQSTRDPLLQADLDRLDMVLRVRSAASTWADSVAGQMDRHYSPGRTWEATTRSLLGLAHLGDVIDLASGDGLLAELVAPRARSVTCLDLSFDVARACRGRLQHLHNVRVCRGDMHRLPFTDACFDQALIMNALTYSLSAAKLLHEVARVLRPGGALVGCTLKKHPYQDVVESYNHLGCGFDASELRVLLEEAGFSVDLCEVTSRERRQPCFEVITLHARRGSPPATSTPPGS
ncbi:MAG: metalloregulator ArsR/SmtB family transcription factor [Planctomycetota bacterium]